MVELSVSEFKVLVSCIGKVQPILVPVTLPILKPLLATVEVK